MTFRACAGAALLALLLTLALAACGGGEPEAQVASIETTETTGTDTTTTETTPSDDPEEALLAYTRCLREHGVDIEDPQNGRLLIRPGGGDGPPSRAEMDEFREANEACADLRANLPTPQLSEEDRAEMQDALLAFARCMREHGVDLPDPEFDDGGGGFRMGAGGRGVDPTDPDFQAARDACEQHLRPLQERFERRSETS
jgi:hypothetical protein